jgi:hypothetical protein
MTSDDYGNPSARVVSRRRFFCLFVEACLAGGLSVEAGGGGWKIAGGFHG